MVERRAIVAENSWRYTTLLQIERLLFGAWRRPTRGATEFAMNVIGPRHYGCRGLDGRCTRRLVIQVPATALDRLGPRIAIVRQVGAMRALAARRAAAEGRRTYGLKPADRADDLSLLYMRSGAPSSRLGIPKTRSEDDSANGKIERHGRRIR